MTFKDLLENLSRTTTHIWKDFRYRHGASFTKYPTRFLRLFYDNAKVTIDLRRTSNLQNIIRKVQGFSWVQFTCRDRKIVRDCVRQLAGDIPKRNLITPKVTVVSRPYDKLLTDRTIFCNGPMIRNRSFITERVISIHRNSSGGQPRAENFFLTPLYTTRQQSYSGTFQGLARTTFIYKDFRWLEFAVFKIQVGPTLRDFEGPKGILSATYLWAILDRRCTVRLKLRYNYSATVYKSVLQTLHYTEPSHSIILQT